MATKPSWWCFADNNECTAQPSLCGAKGQCLNTPGSYNCECQKGFSLDSSGVNCEGGAGPPWGGTLRFSEEPQSWWELPGVFGQRFQGWGGVVEGSGQGEGWTGWSLGKGMVQERSQSRAGDSPGLSWDQGLSQQGCLGVSLQSQNGAQEQHGGCQVGS